MQRPSEQTHQAGLVPRAPQAIAVAAFGSGLFIAIVGASTISAVGQAVPTQLWDVITTLSGALLGLMIPSPAQRRELKRTFASRQKQSAATGPGESWLDTIDSRLIIASLLATSAVVGAVFLYHSAGHDPQCLASVGTLTTTVDKPAEASGSATDRTTVKNVTTLNIGRIGSVHTDTIGTAGTPAVARTAANQTTRCSKDQTADALVALALGVLAAILGILVPSFKAPETLELTPAKAAGSSAKVSDS